MPTGKITKSSVDGLEPPPSGKRFLWDEKTSGFGVYVTASGKRTYILQYRMGGRRSPTRRYTIGRHGSPYTPEKARERAIELLYDIRRGVDPIEELRRGEEATATDQSLRFDTYVDTFFKQYVEPRRLRKAKQTRQTFDRDLIPHFKDKPITEITRKDVVALLDELSSRSRGAANDAYSTLRTMFFFAQKRSDLAVSPIAGMGKPHRFPAGKRALEDWEIQRCWEAANDIGGVVGAFVMMLIMTGQRVREVLRMRWEDIDYDRYLWTIPAENAKNKLEHKVPVTEFILRFLEDNWPAPHDRHGLLFSLNGRNPLADISKRKKRLDANIKRRIALSDGQAHRKGMAHFKLQDLRRSVATGMQRLGIPEPHTEALLNHISGTRAGIVRVYQTYEYAPEVVLALTKWHAHIQSLMAREDAWPGGRHLPPLKVPVGKAKSSMSEG